MPVQYAPCVVGLMLLVAIQIASAADLQPRIAAGPVVLDKQIDGQWGGHTFAYLLEGPHSLFFSATAFHERDQAWASIVGQFPKAANGGPSKTTRIPLTRQRIHISTPPLLLRSADGYLHVFIRVAHSTSNPNYAPGELKYFRSVRPDDVGEFVDRSELIPQQPPYSDFHLRMNAGISHDGQRAAIVILAISESGSVSFNTPLIFTGQKHGADCIFDKPVVYAPPTGLFYPQVALELLSIVVF